jgi:hypothetical protein
VQEKPGLKANADFCAIVQKPLLDLSHHSYVKKLHPGTLLSVSAIMDFWNK